MKHTREFLSVTIALCLTFSALSQKKEIIGYYPSWKWKSRNNLMTPARIPYDKLTIINYAFFYPLPDGRVVGRDTVGDDIYLQGERDLTTGEHKPETSLMALAHRNKVKVVLSLGGWEDSDNFPVVAAGAASRAHLAHSCIERIREFGFDGIDVDWEFPGYAEHKGTPEDKQNFTLLLHTLKDSLTALGVQSAKSYLLTAALPANPGETASMDIEKVAPILDQLNIMTYDFSGPWDPISNHNSPLYAPRPEDSTHNVDAAFKKYHTVYGIPSEKINLGVPFYAHTFSNCTELHAPHAGSDTVHFSKDGAFYYDIVTIMDKFTRRWDDRAKAPYLVSTNWNMLVSYDDEESIRCKAQYVVENNARGLIIWEITGDYLPDHRTPLLDAIHDTFYGTNIKHQ